MLAVKGAARPLPVKAALSARAVPLGTRTTLSTLDARRAALLAHRSVLLRLLAREELVAAQLALQSTVQQLVARRGAQADLGEVLRLIGDDPRCAARVVMLQSLADHAVEGVALTQPEALAIGRIGHQQRGLGRCRAVLESTMFHVDHFLQPRQTHVVPRDLHGRDRYVRAVDMVVEGALLLLGLLLDLTEELGIIVVPALEGEATAIAPWGDAAGDEGRLNEQRTRPAHGVDEIALSIPARQTQDARGEHFAHRGLGLGGTPAALVQALARAVQRQRHLLLRDMDVEAQVRIVEAHPRARPLLLHEVVHQRVLGSVAYIAAVGEGVGVDHRVEGEGIRRPHPLAPVEAAQRLIELIGGTGAEAGQRQQHAQRRTQLIVRAIEEGPIAAEGDHTAAFLHLLGAEGDEFLGQDGLQGLERLGDHSVGLMH